jgi:diketogulonate reductase-like aldo/keto reductase|eukprot:CAMPEP_0174304204 /NCGR_PEP_ID=MMETSP0809-20121228/60636_1 /TAXON_ID=73025 ORGANISM="Eutreptiella gymnastica-like, Strain CCMP1594" /NCGR_SAMPLE_ID=MMETSP0809 /ASSEMBLY_ACC=CAM_ASM_000658 /LENGTH=69 /DNA_ID=CAMNT_0015410365 /DNA_START=151 /DNA_END=360 /DNA_ORIENTATION=-
MFPKAHETSPSMLGLWGLRGLRADLQQTHLPVSKLCFEEFSALEEWVDNGRICLIGMIVDGHNGDSIHR